MKINLLLQLNNQPTWLKKDLKKIRLDRKSNSDLSATFAMTRCNGLSIELIKLTISFSLACCPVALVSAQSQPTCLSILFQY